MSENLSQPHGQQSAQDQTPDLQPKSDMPGDPPSSGLDARQSEQIVNNLDGIQQQQMQSKNQMVTNPSGQQVTDVPGQNKNSSGKTSEKEGISANPMQQYQSVNHQQQIFMQQQQQYQQQQQVPFQQSRQIFGPGNVSVSNTNYSNTFVNAAQAQLQGNNQYMNNSGIAMDGNHMKSMRSTASKRSVRSSGNNSQLDDQISLMTQSTAPSSIPGKTQRVLINKKQPFSASSAATRCFKRGQSHNKTGSKGSIWGTSALATNSSFSSFASASSKQKQEQQFGMKQRRFDAKIELKEYFNREPGPGAYQNTKPIEDQNNLESQSKRGIMNGFVSKSDRFQVTAGSGNVDPTLNVGPGQYDPMPIQKNITVPKLDPKGEFSLPFNEKNPLNFVKAITVNIYFKQSNPGVGYYDPEPQYKTVPAAQSVFQSVTNRNPQENTRKLVENQLQPAPGTYDKRDGFDVSYEQKDIGTRQFKNPMPKKIVTVNLHNPHSAPDEKKNIQPGPGQYDVHREFDPIQEVEGEEDFSQPRYNHQIGGKVYIEDNKDRFGLPIRPLKPIEMKPGPAHYYLEGLGGANNLADKSYPMEDAKQFTQAERNTQEVPGAPVQKVPGPSYYNSIQEPKKISFLFNPAEKWVQ